VRERHGPRHKHAHPDGDAKPLTDGDAEPLADGGAPLLRAVVHTAFTCCTCMRLSGRTQQKCLVVRLGSRASGLLACALTPERRAREILPHHGVLGHGRTCRGERVSVRGVCAQVNRNVNNAASTGAPLANTNSGTSTSATTTGSNLVNTYGGCACANPVQTLYKPYQHVWAHGRRSWSPARRARALLTPSLLTMLCRSCPSEQC